MPCYDDRTGPVYLDFTIEPRKTERSRKDLAKTEAYLCAIIKVLEKNKLLLNVMMQIDEQEAGIHPADIYGWWVQHSIKDAKRIDKEKSNEPKD